MEVKVHMIDKPCVFRLLHFVEIPRASNPEMWRKTGQTELYVFQARHINPSNLTSRCGCDTISAFKAKQTPGGYGWLSLPNPYYPRCGYVFALCSVTHLSVSHFCDSLCDYRLGNLWSVFAN